MESKEPYRATRLWNEVITAFQSGMPLKKHRRRIQTYNNCFSASEAVTWLHCYLMNNTNFGLDVTRQQTVNLLQKFLKCHVIESIVVRSKRKEFSDDSHLYRFTSISSQISKPSALCLIQSPSFGARNSNREKTKVEPPAPKPSSHFQKENLPECHFVERKLTADEVKLMWKKVTLSRLEKLLPYPSFIDILEMKDVDGHVIKHNVSRLSKTGVVCLVDKTDDIPHWVISAMKCLANWPNASGSGSCLPNYPGFEKDVFKVVRDFFINTQVPLLPVFLTPLLIKVFCHFTDNEYMDFNKAKTTPTSQKPNNSTSSHLSNSSSSDVKTSTPVCNTEHSNLKEISHGKLLLDDPEVMWDYPSTVFYETDFATSNPVTRVLSNHNSPRSRSHSCADSIGSIGSVSTISVCSQLNHRLDAFAENRSSPKSPLKPWSSNMYLQDEVRETSLRHNISPRTYSRLEYADSTPSMKGSLSHHSNVYLCEINDLDTSNLSSKTVTEEGERGMDAKRYSRQGLYCSSSAIYSEEFSSRARQTPHKSINKDFVRKNVYCEDLKKSFQLMLLIMPSANRRQLHLLLRLLSKVLKNGKFLLNVDGSMHNYLLETFLPAIVQSEQNPLLLFEMAAFLLDNCEMLFQTPQGLKQEVDDLSRSCFGRIRYTVDDTCSLTYCELVSKQQYEEQRSSVSNEALRSLLRSILHDPSISDKERKRKMKQFKESHPEVYYHEFPEKLGHLTRPKPTLLNRLVNLRM